MTVMSWPVKRMVPPSLRSVPEMQLMSVVLPEPFGPMRPSRSPALTWRLTRLSAVKPPKRLVRPSTSRSAPATGRLPSADPPGQAENPLGGQHDEDDEEDAHDQQIQRGGDRHRGHLLHGGQEHGADHRPDPRGGAAYHRHGEAVHGVVEIEGGERVHESDVVRKRRAGDAHETAAHRS